MNLTACCDAAPWYFSSHTPSVLRRKASTPSLTRRASSSSTVLASSPALSRSLLLWAKANATHPDTHECPCIALARAFFAHIRARIPSFASVRGSAPLQSLHPFPPDYLFASLQLCHQPYSKHCARCQQPLILLCFKIASLTTVPASSARLSSCSPLYAARTHELRPRTSDAAIGQLVLATLRSTALLPTRFRRISLSPSCALRAIKHRAPPTRPSFRPSRGA
mmetsp:Transcript_11510/g.31039  ORF Transcript_11510/g.31039 Transcript_11510/m.31039 type:complete len:223 (-) Transcript_11510:7-675(-)